MCPEPYRQFSRLKMNLIQPGYRLQTSLRQGLIHLILSDLSLPQVAANGKLGYCEARQKE